MKGHTQTSSVTHVTHTTYTCVGRKGGEREWVSSHPPKSELIYWLPSLPQNGWLKTDRECKLTLSVIKHNLRAINSQPCTYGGPVGRGYEQRFESKNEYEQRSESKIAYGPRAKLRTVREQNCVRSESKIAYGLRAKLRTV